VATRGFNGVWSVPATLDFEILPPWWQTWWAYLLFASLFGGLTYGIVHVRSQYLKKENRILEEKVFHRTSQLKKSIDDLKATQSQLIQSEKMASLGELTAGIAHEIQNPLNFVNNFSEVNSELIDEQLEEIEKGDLEEVKELAHLLKENSSKITLHGKRADAIVKGMLEHSKRGSGQKELTDLNALADDFLRMTYQSFLAKDPNFKVELQTILATDLPKISVIPQDIGKVLLNLYSNAFYACAERSRSFGTSSFDVQHSKFDIKYSPNVTVSTKTLGDKIEIKVSDNGPGIPDTIKSKIFQPFFTTKPTGQGTGLGLSLSYDIVKAHGGEIKVETKEGKGTEFIVQIPNS
jgi:signal transduction histidine kinase